MFVPLFLKRQCDRTLGTAALLLRTEFEWEGVDQLGHNMTFHYTGAREFTIPCATVYPLAAEARARAIAIARISIPRLQ